MTGMLNAAPLSPAPEARPFWEAANRHELLLPFCVTCQQFFFYPRPLCPRCGTRDLDWRRCSGQGRVYTYCVQYQTAVPFVTVIVELVEGPRLMSILVDVAPDPTAVRCDMPVEVAFVDRPDGQSLPVFRPASPVSR
jgi:uncharacterized OB-fold protein